VARLAVIRHLHRYVIDVGRIRWRRLHGGRASRCRCPDSQHLNELTTGHLSAFVLLKQPADDVLHTSSPFFGSGLKAQGAAMSLEPSEVKLRAELENPRILYFRRLTPLLSERVVDLDGGAAVEHVVDVEIALHPKPWRQSNLLGHPNIQTPYAMVVHRARHHERDGRGRRA